MPSEPLLTGPSTYSDEIVRTASLGAIQASLGDLQRRVVAGMFLRAYIASQITLDVIILVSSLFTSYVVQHSTILVQVIVVLSALVGVGRCVAVKAPYAVMARLIDQRAGLRERVSTAFELEAGTNSRMIGLLESDALRAVRQVDIRRMAPLRRESILAAIVLAVTFAICLLRAPEANNSSRFVSSVLVSAPGQGTRNLRAVQAPASTLRSMVPAKSPPAAPGSASTKPISRLQSQSRSPAPTHGNDSAATRAHGATGPSGRSKHTSASAPGEGTSAPRPGSGGKSPTAASPTSGPRQSHAESGSTARSGRNGGSGAKDNNGQSGRSTQSGAVSSRANSSPTRTRSGTDVDRNEQRIGTHPAVAGATSRQRGSAVQGEQKPGQRKRIGSGKETGSTGSASRNAGAGSQSVQSKNSTPGSGTRSSGGRSLRRPGSGSESNNSGGSPGYANGETGGNGRSPQVRARALPPVANASTYSFRLPHASGSGRDNISANPEKPAAKGLHSTGQSRVAYGERSVSAGSTDMVTHVEQDPRIPAGYRQLVKEYFASGGQARPAP